ncbi:Na+/H+ antiporter [Nocardioides sp. KR10-350]|uniref:Na+/H+ antiporter n=1 Tax=Nocardioides cheoyonin TaxID=3156615 RepID=UPI0032B36006
MWRVDIALFLVALAAAVLAVTALAEKSGLPAPLVLIAGGAAASYVPGVPDIHLEPEVVLIGLLPPLLYATAIQSSLVDFNANRRPILLLSVGLVVATTFGIGAIVHAILGTDWAVSLAIGAVVAPPDAVAATAVARNIGLPRRIVTILEGESLLNDATALVSLRTAIAAIGGGVELWHVGLDFVRAAGGGVIVGVVAYLLVGWLRKQITEPVFDTGLSFVVPFAAYLAAEKVEASGVIAVVVAGLLLGHRAPVLQTAQSRIAERMNWRTIAYVLENAVFLLIGLQAQWLIADVGDSSLSWGRIVGVCVATLVGVIAIRMVWVFVARYLLIRPGPDPDSGEEPPWTYTVILGWAGMRGVVTLAAAYLIPEDTPHRETLLLVAFTVVAGTIFVQGLSLPAAARVLNVPAPDPVADALARATLLQQASKAGFKALKKQEYDDPHGVTALVKQRVEQRNFAAWERLGTKPGEEAPSELYNRIRCSMIEAERARVLEIRDSGTVPSDVVSEVLAMLDVEESMLEVASDTRQEINEAIRRRPPVGDICPDLEKYPVVETAEEPVCQACLDEGTRWVSLRQCLVCGNVACCDSSPRRHATLHFHETAHPVMESAEPGEDWRWCFLHHLTA